MLRLNHFLITLEQSRRSVQLSVILKRRKEMIKSIGGNYRRSLWYTLHRTL